MKTPICDFVKNYVDSKSIRLHMPGHKGKEYPYDITEIDGADALYLANGIIKESEENASKLFGSYKTLYSTEGSSLCIKTMLHLAKAYGKGQNRSYVIAGRNAHTSFISASILVDFNVKWIYPKNDKSYLSCEIVPSELDLMLSNAEELPFAVYITSPDYLGNVSDIKGISTVCKKHGVILIVDNAHGAYLKFGELSTHPLDLGADMCCDSAHKTLPVLTGGAYLHISKNAPEYFSEFAKSVMCIYGSTSPSYLILQSLDKCNRYLDSGYRDKLNSISKKVQEIKKSLTVCGYSLIGDETMKISIDTKEYGYNGVDFAKILIENNIVPEFYDSDFLVLMISSENTDSELDTICSVLKAIPKKQAIKKQAFIYTPLDIVMSPRDAYFSEKTLTSVDNSLGCIYADTTVSCPPAVSIAVCGERINESTISIFKYYGIKKIYTIKNSQI
ncbi:MAG: aminotransferase class V-fold PLP-dependent enzyme [Clostridia bacterium]|nr:aminotransferase class V-fold PLP-dependent enzyme [Clostridia bacterium]